MDRSLHTLLCRFAAVIMLTSVGGCAGTHIPEIDPTGEHIFSPAPASTTIDLPWIGDTPWPKPAFSAPPANPIVTNPAFAPGTTPQPTAANPAIGPTLSGSSKRTGLPATVTLSPSQMVAPVGSEVVLLAGLCGVDGYYVCNQPVQWTLSQESVGAIVAISSDGGSLWKRWMRTQSQHLGSNFCHTTTSTRERRLDRGTPNPHDDIQVLSGQTWISLSSASEGISYLTASSEAISDWQRKQKTAAIHWIDAQWTFPAPTLARAGESQTLSTTVQRQSSGEPVVGWIVRYEITSGVEAQLVGPDGATGRGIDVITNEQGLAEVQVVSAAANPGTTAIGISIIRPEVSGTEIHRLQAGLGTTSVTWSAPGLALHLSGPISMGQDETVKLHATLTNNGDLPSTDVRLSMESVPQLALQSSIPSDHVFGDRHEWRLGDLPPHTTKTVELTLRADQAGAARPCLSATSGEGLSANACHDIAIIRQAFGLRITGPETAEVGEQIQHHISITNNSDSAISNAVLSDLIDSGLHFSGEGQDQRPFPNNGAGSGGHHIQRTIDSIAPGETKQILVLLTADAPGRHCHTITLSAPGVVSASRKVCIEISHPVNPVQPLRPNLSVQISGPSESRVGESPTYTIDVTNTGETTLTNVHVVNQYDAELIPHEASENHVSTAGQLEWVLASIAPGESKPFGIQFRCDRTTSRACTRVTVTNDQNMTVTDEACLSIADREESIEMGQLEVDIADTADPIRSGESTTYIISVKNVGATSDHTVSLTFAVPEGMQIQQVADSPVEMRSHTRDGRSIEMTPIAELRANETLVFRVEVQANRSGRYTFEARASSRRLAETIVVTEDTTVNID